MWTYLNWCFAYGFVIGCVWICHRLYIYLESQTACKFLRRYMLICVELKFDLYEAAYGFVTSFMCFCQKLNVDLLTKLVVANRASSF